MTTPIWKPAILINVNAANGKARLRWQSIRVRVLESLPQETVERYTSSIEDLKKELQELIHLGFNCFIAAGGDGTVNTLLNVLFDAHSKFNGIEFALGSIALGSSNDFCKPVINRIGGRPVRVDLNGAVLHDVGSVQFENDNQPSQITYFIVNASIGVTAEANLLFNRKNFFISIVKNQFVNLAIAYAAIRTILGFKNISVTMKFNQQHYKGRVANVAVLKNPCVSGSFKYDQQISTQDGFLGLNYCGDISRLQLVQTLLDLSRGKFGGRKNRVSKLVQRIMIQSEKPIALETDGEVRLATEMNFSILPSSIFVLK